MAATDRRTVELGTPIATLMENAGSAVARFCLSRYADATRVLVLCGKGNNGGDGMVAARVLAETGCDVAVVLLGRAADVKGEAAEALSRARGAGDKIQFIEVPDEAAFAERIAKLPVPELVLDAIVGTGFKPPLRGIAVTAREWVARISAPVVAVDLPSGWDADSVEENADGAFRADAVVTFTAPKPAHVFGYIARPREGSQGAWSFGPVVVADIGSPDQAIADSVAGNDVLEWAGSARAIADALRPVNANKGKFGHVLIVGGNEGISGAPSMSSLGALRAGAGLVTAAVPRSVASNVGLVAVELMVSPLEQGAEGAVAIAELARVQEIVRETKISVVALGPGLSTRGDASEFARRLVAEVKLPMVVDADGLNAFAGKAELLKSAAKDKTLVLTPHPGEMARLAGISVAEVEKDRVGLARRFASEYGVSLLLKGWRTLIAHPDGRVAVNTSGNPAMAKGGSGDILTGIVAAMLAQYPNAAAKAVEAAVYLHGLAGDWAARRMDQHTVLATDTLRHLSDAFQQPLRDRDGFVWIAGLPSRGGYRGGCGSRRPR